MLDKSVPYFDILMHRKKGTPIPVAELPTGFKFSFFKPGDEKAWAKIEASVYEFSDELEALIYFQKEYLPFVSELERRCLFIENEKGEKIATSTAWWNYTGIRRDPWLHWVAVHPNYQNLGLGKAIVSKVLQLTLEIEGDRDFYLHTQTWSHRAVKIYEKLGYIITSEKNLNNHSNENYEKAMDVLNSIYAKE
ncbi:MAG: GNAT family N-acetyltransferase [Defluviitaleaceae bacterium]|nr:GNAT family N-acetyltransferase [Defluviitaleaceae bacterium]